ncbi:MAG: phytanoyl-CoA dioxygenase family protein [Planctomycetes bacterium]|nr:phytanoyl-CoA dioxygenase family protein [Planctomycetota bacterium]
MQLTQEQKNFFETFGFISFPGLLKDRIGQVIEDFETTWKKVGGGHNGKPHDGKKRSCIGMYQTEGIVSLLDDPRLVGIASSLLGADYNFMGGDGNYYVGDTSWHSDGWHAKVMHIKIAFYLDPLTRDTGCLRVIPGSHRINDGFAKDLQSHLGKSQEYYGKSGCEIPAIALETTPGDVLVFNHNTKHSAFGGGSWRRMFTMNLCEQYPQENLQELKDYLSGAARFWAMEPYNSAVLKNAPATRMRHLQQVIDNFGHVPALSRKMMETMAEPARG